MGSYNYWARLYWASDDILTLPLSTSPQSQYHVKLTEKTLMFSRIRLFCKQVCHLVIYLDLLHLDFFLQDLLSNEMVLHLHMLCSTNFLLDESQIGCRKEVILDTQFSGANLPLRVSTMYFPELLQPLLYTLLLQLIMILLVVSCYTKKLFPNQT